MKSSSRGDEKPKPSRHRWEGPIAGGVTKDGEPWEGFVCKRCGRCITRPKGSTVILSWAHEFLGRWGEGPLPECKETDE